LYGENGFFDINKEWNVAIADRTTIFTALMTNVLKCDMGIDIGTNHIRIV